MAGLNNPSDLGTSYAGSVQNGEAAAALARLQQFVVPETGEVITLPSANGNVIEVTPRGTEPGDGTGGAGGGQGGGIGTGQGDGMGNAGAGAAADRAGFMGDVVDAMGRVGRNVGDAARQVVNAPFAALREMFRAADDIGNYLTGSATPTDAEATFAGNPGRAIARNIPQLAPAPDTPAGKVAADISQFLAGFMGGGRVVRGVAGFMGGGRVVRGVAGGAARTGAGRAAEGLAAGGIADFFASDPNQARLAELWQQAGLPATALTQYLADRTDDTQAEARLKRAVEGGITGVGVDALIAAARGFRAASMGRQAAQPTARQQQQQAQQMVGAAMRPLGNPDPAAPLIARDVMAFGGEIGGRAGGNTGGDAGQRMAAASGATSDAATGVSAETSARGLAGAAEAQRRLAAFRPPVWLAGEAADGPAPAAVPGLPNAVRDLLAAMRRGRIGPRGEVSLTAFVRAHGGIQDPGGDILSGLGGTTRTAPALINRNGMRQERMMQNAIEQGYIPSSATLNDFIEMVVEDATGRARHYGSTLDEAGRALAQAADDLDATLAAHGLRADSPIEDIARAIGSEPDGAARTLADLEAEDTARTVAGPVEGLPLIENTTAIRAARDTGPVFINWARIQAPEDVQAVIRDAADAFRGDINAAGREVQTNAETGRLADALGVTVQDLLSRAPGQPWNAEMALAARRLMVASGEKLAELARAAADPNAAPAAAWAFRRQMAVHYAIQAEVLAARRETARALQSWAMPAGSAREQQRAIEQMLEQSGGLVTAQAMAGRLNALTDAGASTAQVGAYARTAALATRIGGAVQEAWINALLSSPKTHMVNVMSNSFNAALAVVERRGAEMMGSEVERGEAAAMTYGLVTGLRDAWRLGGQTWRDGTGAVGAMLGKIDVPHERAISAQAFGVDPGSGLGRGLDFLGHSVVSAPSRALGAEDAFFKSIAYRMELHAGALRMARQEATAGGFAPGSADFAREVSDRMRLMLNDPPEALRLQAADMALYSTFNRQAGPWAQGLLGLRERIPGTVFIMPFIRTPMNILSYSFERTPLAPLVGQWRADVAAGGARRDLALARLSMGTIAMAVAFDMADRGEITGRGPDDSGEVENLRNQGWQPYAIRMGDTWVSYNRLDPFGFTLGFAADFADMLRRREVEPGEVDEADELMAAAIATVSRSVVDKTWMQGISALIEALDKPEQGARAWMQQMAGSFVPAVVGQAALATKPEGSVATNPAEAVMARIPILADSLPPKRNRWGDVIRPETTGRAVFDAFSPVRVTDVRESPVDAELQRLGVNLPRMDMRQEFPGGADVNMRDYTRAYDDLVRMAGNDWKNPATGLGLRDALEEMIRGEGVMGAAYQRQSDGREGGKAMMIQSIVRTYRQAARQALLQMPEHADLAAVVGQRRAETADRMTPPEMR